MTLFSLPPDTQINLSVLRSCGQGTQLLHWTWLILHKQLTGTQIMGISLLSRKTRTQMDLIQHSPTKEMEISAVKVYNVLQESLGLSRFHSPPPTFFLKTRIPSKLFRWQTTTATIRAWWSQSSGGRDTLTTVCHWHPVPCLASTAKAKKHLLVQPPLQITTNTQIPSDSNCMATREKDLQNCSILHHWLTDPLFKSPHEVLLSVSYVLTPYIVPERNTAF